MIRLMRRRPRVLVLDDDASMRRLVALHLGRAGVAVDGFAKGNEAITAIEEGNYPAVLLDLMMPVEGGMTVIRHLRETNPELLKRVILLTAAPETLLRSVEPEVFAIVRKPFQPEELVGTVEKLTKAKR